MQKPAVLRSLEVASTSSTSRLLRGEKDTPIHGSPDKKATLRTTAFYTVARPAEGVPHLPTSSSSACPNHLVSDFSVDLRSGHVAFLCSITCCHPVAPNIITRAWLSLYRVLAFIVSTLWNCRRPQDNSASRQSLQVFPDSTLPQLQRVSARLDELAKIREEGTVSAPQPESFPRYLLYLYTAFLSPSDVLPVYRTSLQGLTEVDCETRLAAFGPNVLLASSQKLHPAFQYLQQLRAPFNILLLSLSLTIYLTGDNVGGSIVLGMVALSTILTFAQEYRSNSAVEKLRSLVTSTVAVTRRGTGCLGTTGQVVVIAEPFVPPISPSLLQPASTTESLDAAFSQGSAEGATRQPEPSLSPSPINMSFPPTFAFHPLATPVARVKANETFASPPSSTGESATFEVATKALCVGDVIHLQAGSVLPADCRILVSRDLLVSQASMNGESLPVEKYALSFPAPFFDLTSEQDGHDEHKEAVMAAAGEAEVKIPVSLFDCPNLLFMGTSIVSGTATCVVMSLAKDSYFGSIADRVTGTRERTAFDQGITAYTRLMLKFMFVMIGVVITISGTSTGDWFSAFLFGIAVAVGLTPEMLPMIITVNLARGAQVMMKGGVIVKRLSSIQNLGAMDVLCTDKTGTLTCDELHLVRYSGLCVDASSPNQPATVLYPSSPPAVLLAAYLNSHFQTGLKNVMDQAVVRAQVLATGEEIPAVEWSKVDEVPFDFQRRRMSVVVRHSSATVTDSEDEEERKREEKGAADLGVLARSHLLICKGAVEEMLGVCDAFGAAPVLDSLADVVSPPFSLSEGLKTAVQAHCEELNNDGLRVLLLAYRIFPARDKQVYAVTDESHLVLCGLLAFADPPKESTATALRALSDQHIAVKVLSGDNAAVCRHVCQSVGIECATMLSGHEVSAMSDAQLSKQVETTQVFAKLTPMDKERIVRALNALGHVVGFLGDGINDAAALRASDVGISVDNAVDIAKEAADLILLQKDLTILSRGVRAGRTVFGNIIKYIKMGASSNFGNVFSVCGSSLWLSFEPMGYLQLLTQNLLYDFSQIGIPFDEVDEEYLAAPRRWEIGDIAKFMLCIGPISSIFDYCTFLLAWFYFGVGADQSDANITLFQSMWFVEGLLTQTLIVHIIRTRHVPFLTKAGRAALPLALTTFTVMCVGLAFPHFGVVLADSIPLKPPPAMFYPFLILFLASYCVLTHVVKMWYYKTFGYR